MSNIRSISPFSDKDGQFTKVVLYLKGPLDFQGMARFVNEIEDKLSPKEPEIPDADPLKSQAMAAFDSLLENFRRLHESEVRAKILEKRGLVINPLPLEGGAHEPKRGEEGVK